MAKKTRKPRDTDYLFISAYLRSRERNLLTAARMERMIEAGSASDAAKVLQEIGYGEFPAESERELGAVLAREREALFQDLYRYVPDKSVVDVFKVKYDYHNLKAMLKAQAMKTDGRRLLMDAGRVSAETMAKAISEGSYDLLPEPLRSAAEEAFEVLSATGDPQRADFVLDRAYFTEMLAAAEATGSGLLKDYVRAQIDSANLRSVVRTLRMKGSSELLKKVVFFEGGSVPAVDILAGALGGDVEGLFRSSHMRHAAQLGAEAARGGDLTKFEKACDDAVTSVAAKAKGVPFGVEAVIGYLVAKEIEFTSVRVILSGHLAGIGAETIRERLREAYV